MHDQHASSTWTTILMCSNCASSFNHVHRILARGGQVFSLYRVKGNTPLWIWGQAQFLRTHHIWFQPLPEYPRGVSGLLPPPVYVSVLIEFSYYKKKEISQKIQKYFKFKFYFFCFLKVIFIVNNENFFENFIWKTLLPFSKCIVNTTYMISSKLFINPKKTWNWVRIFKKCFIWSETNENVKNDIICYYIVQVNFMITFQ